jgi:hypothetical protein
MSTPNFANRNASKYFVLEIEDDFEYDMQKEDIQYYLSEHGYEEMDSRPHDDNRSYPSVIIAQKSVEKYFGDFSVEIIINVLIRSGYYAGVNLDWEIEIETPYDKYNDEIPEKDWIIDQFEDEGYSRGFGTIQSKNVLNFIDKTIIQLSEETEEHLGKLTETYVRTALFSNGEAIYEKVS